MRIVLVSNYINHHQIPFCQAMCRQEDVDFTFIQTEPMEEERVRMGWQSAVSLPFLRLFYEEPQVCRELIAESEVVIFGGCEDESYIVERLQAGKPVVRYSERLYKEGQWKAVSPRGLLKKYKDHVKYRRAPVYLLCAGAYVADDFHIIRAYPGKMYRWGYFPEKKEYDLEKLFREKGYSREDVSEAERKKSVQVPYILWAGRMIGWKHPELAVYAAKRLKDRGIPFHLDMAGGGALEKRIKELTERLELTEEVTLTGFRTPTQIREMMERADICLITSDRKEGWGAVVNEAMNSGCAVIADHMVGAVPYLIRHGKNGMIYRDGDSEQLYEIAARLACDPEMRRKLGEGAYRTIVEVWNPETAAANLMKLLAEIGIVQPQESGGREKIGSYADLERGKDEKGSEGSSLEDPDLTGPCSPAPVIHERLMYRHLMRDPVKEIR